MPIRAAPPPASCLPQVRAARERLFLPHAASARSGGTPTPCADHDPPLGARVCQEQACGAVAEWSKAHAWKVCIRQPRIEGSNPSRSAISPFCGAGIFTDKLLKNRGNQRFFPPVAFHSIRPHLTKSVG